MRRLCHIVAAILAVSPVLARADVLNGGISPAALCRAAIAAAERATGVPDRLMQAIGIVESGQADERGGTSAWPWTINVQGTGYVFRTKQEAMDAVARYQAQGIRSIDVGCMQVNLMHHGNAFSTLDQAFDPAVNARYAAGFLLQLLAQTGSWPRAAAGYHSMTPEIGADYARKVLAVWSRPGLGDGALAQFRRGPLEQSMMPPASALTATPARTTLSALVQAAPGLPTFNGNLGVGGSMTAHVIPLNGAAGGGSAGGGNAPGGNMVVGRSLASYRAMPTRLATTGLPTRF